MKQALSLLIVLGCLVPTAAADDKLGVGDKAPKLTIKHWLKGEAVDPTTAPKDKVFVVEFWATWCGPCIQGIPHLSDMQDHFKSKGVTFVGISAEKKKTVEKFMKGPIGSGMRYTVAIDDGRKTNNDWMKAAKQRGIPCAFVIKGGEIKWIGHPAGELDEKVAELCGDTEYAEKKKAIRKLSGEFADHSQKKKWDKAVAALRKIQELDSHKFHYAYTEYHILQTKLKNTAEAAALGQKLVKNSKIPGEMNQLSWEILTSEDFADARDKKLAMAAAEKAMKLSNESDPAIVDTYARALAETGKINEAITWQKKAIELAGEDARLKRELKKVLEEYEERAKPKVG